MMRIMMNQVTVTPPTPRPGLDVQPTGRLKMDLLLPRRQKDKVLILMGATGTGKSRLSIDLATRFPAEIINSDKMQVYEGLDVVTNKITEREQLGVPHHMLGTHHPNSDFTVQNFRDMASASIESVLNKGKLPIIVGGSNSYVEALVDDEDYLFRSKYECCFLWVDVSLPVLHNFVSERVDRMVQNGLVDEVRRLFHPEADYSKGVRRAIGVPEFHLYFKTEASYDDDRDSVLREAIQAVKDNTFKLACRQLEKIRRLKNVKGWDIHPVDATEVFRRRNRRHTEKKRGKTAEAAADGDDEEDDDEAQVAWEQHVAGPSTGLVAEFLYSRVLADQVPPGPVAAIRGRHIITRCLVA